MANRVRGKNSLKFIRCRIVISFLFNLLNNIMTQQIREINSRIYPFTNGKIISHDIIPRNDKPIEIYNG